MNPIIRVTKAPNRRKRASHVLGSDRARSAGLGVRRSIRFHKYRSAISGTENEAAVLPQCLSLCHPPLLALSTQDMSQTRSNDSSSSNFQSALNAALDAYEKKTKNKLLTHPLAAQLRSCDSPTAILSVLHDLIQQLDRRRRSDERLTNWLNPTVNVLYAFSSTLGQGVGVVSLNWISFWNL